MRKGAVMMVDARLIRGDLPAGRSAADAYEIYWCATESEGSAPLFSAGEPSRCCRPGDAYTELWQLWDAQ